MHGVLCIICIDTLLYIPTQTHTHTCTHVNMHKTHAHTLTHMNAVSGPVITNVTDTDVVAFVGDTVQLKCLASGSPVPSYRWLKNDAAITDSEWSCGPSTCSLVAMLA